MVDYIDLTPTSRLQVDVDPVPLDPRKDECVTGTFTPIVQWTHWVDGPENKFEFPGDLQAAHDRLYQPSRWASEARVVRWAWANFDTLVQRHGSTYWWCDRAMFDTVIGGEFSRGAQAEVIDADRREYDRFLAGDARQITLQRKSVFRRISTRWSADQQELLEVWEDVDAVADVYLDEDNTVAQFAFDNFTFQRKELATIHAMIDSERTLP